MSAVPFARLVRDALVDDLQSAERGLVSGTETWDEYQRLVGKRQGLLLALNVIDDVSKRFDEQD